METSSRVKNVDRLEKGVLIEFEDGRTFVYTWTLLRSMIPVAIEWDTSDETED
jgi:hypothetical protein